GDLDELDPILEPVDEVRKRVLLELFRKQTVELGIAGDEGVDGLGGIGRRLVLAVLEQCLHAVIAIGNIEVERLLAELLRVDKLVDAHDLFAVLLKSPKVGQKEGQTRETLLTVDYERLAALL